MSNISKNMEYLEFQLEKFLHSHHTVIENGYEILHTVKVGVRFPNRNFDDPVAMRENARYLEALLEENLHSHHEEEEQSL